MKKFTLFLSLMVAMVTTTMAQTLATLADGFYTIQGDANGQRGYMAACEGYADYPVLSEITLSGYTQNGVTAIENGKNWYVVTNNGKSFVYNVGLNKFLVEESGNVNFGDTPYAWSIVVNGSYTSLYTGGKYLSMGCSRTAADRPVRFDTNANDGGSQHTFTTVVVDGFDTTAVNEAIADYVATYTDAPLTESYYYQIKNVAYDRVLSANNSNKATTITYVEGSTDAAQLWALESTGNGTYYLKSANNDKYLVHNINNNTCWTVADAGTAFNLHIVAGKSPSNANTCYAINYDLSDSYSSAHDANWGNEDRVVRWDWKATASQWVFIETEIPTSAVPVTVNYSLKYNGVEMYTQTTNAFSGQPYPYVNVELPFGVTASAPEGVIEAKDVVDGVVTANIVLEVNVPFAYADSYAAVEWQFLKFDAGNNFYLHHDADQNYIDLNSTTFEPNNIDIYFWGFIGNPFDGYKIVNKGAGEGYILSSSTTMSGTTGSDTWPIMTAEESLPEGNNELWIATASENAENGFFLAQKNFPSNRMNNRGKLAYWTGGAGSGSTFVVESEAAGVEVLTNCMISALGYVGGYTADKAEAIEAINTFTGIAEFQNANQGSMIELDVNKYYRIQNVFRDHVVTVNASSERVSADLNNASVAQLWKFEAGETEGTYLIKSPNANACMLGAGASNTLAETGAEFEVYNLGDGYGQFNLKQKDSSALMCEYGTGNIGSWSGGGLNSDMAWYLIPTTSIEVTVNEFASTCLPFAVETVDGVKAYAVESTNSTHAILVEKTDIAAGEGAILEGNGTFTLNIIDEATTDWSVNKLQGTTMDAYLAKDAYVLANGESGIGLYKAALNKDETGADGTTHFKNNANKAYLEVDGAESIACYSFRFGEGTTGVENVEIRNENEEIYDLTGRRVEEITAPGIYIINGVKRIVK